MALHIFYLLAGLGLFSFTTGVILALQPVFVLPTENIRIDKPNDEHDKGIRGCLLVCAVIAPLLLLLLAFHFRGHVVMYPIYGIIGIILIIFSLATGGIMHVFFLMFLVWESISYLHNKVIKFVKQCVSKESMSRCSIRLFYCQTCKNSLFKAHSVAHFLNEREQTALQLGKTTFEAWYCRQCCTGASRDSIHLRRYVDAPFSSYFCSDCDEYTRTIECIEPSESLSGKKISVYTCHSCNKVEEYIWRNP